MDPENWTSLKIHKTSQDICKDTPEDDHILTLSPLYVIEGGGNIYPQFSAGAFAFRIADKLSEDNKIIVTAIGAKDLMDFIKKNEPSAIIIDPDNTFADPIEDLIGSYWQAKEYDIDALRIYLPPQF
jgi:hypothetical protein